MMSVHTHYCPHSHALWLMGSQMECKMCSHTHYCRKFNSYSKKVLNLVTWTYLNTGFPVNPVNSTFVLKAIFVNFPDSAWEWSLLTTLLTTLVIAFHMKTTFTGHASRHLTYWPKCVLHSDWLCMTFSLPFLERCGGVVVVTELWVVANISSSLELQHKVPRLIYSSLWTKSAQIYTWLRILHE